MNEKGEQFISFVGTAFLVGMRSETTNYRGFIYLVTARHVARVLEGQAFAIRANTIDGESIIIDGVGAHWTYHPTDDSVDVAVSQWGVPPNIEFKRIDIDTFATDEIIRQKSIGAGDEVFITGLFAFVTGKRRNLPIVRMGNVALFPSEKVRVKIDDKWTWSEVYLIEARSIGGISGSPVFVRETVEVGRGAFYLLGLVHGHWEIPAEQKNDLANLEDRLVNMGIAIVVPAKKIMEVLNQPKLREERLRIDEEDLRKGQPAPTPDDVGLP